MIGGAEGTWLPQRSVRLSLASSVLLVGYVHALAALPGIAWARGLSALAVLTGTDSGGGQLCAMVAQPHGARRDTGGEACRTMAGLLRERAPLIKGTADRPTAGPPGSAPAPPPTALPPDTADRARSGAGALAEIIGTWLHRHTVQPTRSDAGPPQAVRRTAPCTTAPGTADSPACGHGGQESQAAP